VWELVSPNLPIMYFAKAIILFASSVCWLTGGLLWEASLIECQHACAFIAAFILNFPEHFMIADLYIRSPWHLRGHNLYMSSFADAGTTKSTCSLGLVYNKFAKDTCTCIFLV